MALEIQRKRLKKIRQVGKKADRPTDWLSKK